MKSLVKVFLGMSVLERVECRSGSVEKRALRQTVQRNGKIKVCCIVTHASLRMC